MNKFLDHTHPDAFMDHTKMSPRPEYELTKECPRCKGFGGWILTPNAYNMPAGLPNTAANRMRYVHFRAVCSHCSGAGFTHPSVTCSGHDWVLEKNLGNCYNRYRCIHCSTTSDVDSSD